MIEIEKAKDRNLYQIKDGKFTLVIDEIKPSKSMYTLNLYDRNVYIGDVWVKDEKVNTIGFKLEDLLEDP